MPVPTSEHCLLSYPSRDRLTPSRRLGGIVGVLVIVVAVVLVLLVFIGETADCGGGCRILRVIAPTTNKFFYITLVLGRSVALATESAGVRTYF
jgi:hypothetical protein